MDHQNPLGAACLLTGAAYKYKLMDREVLHDALAECRVRKSDAELELMAYASHISSLAHVAVMRDATPGAFGGEAGGILTTSRPILLALRRGWAG